MGELMQMTQVQWRVKAMQEERRSLTVELTPVGISSNCGQTA